MQTYNYKATDAKTNKTVNDSIEAADEGSAAKALKERGLMVTKLTKKNQSKKMFFSGRVSTKDKILFSRQLSTLINAGLPLVQSLRSIEQQTKSPSLRDIIGRMIHDIEGGTSFASTLGKFPKVFNEVFVSMIAAGEASGTLDGSLERLANQQEKDAEILSKVRGAMVYPMVVLAVMVAVVGFMVVKVLPQVEQLYSGLPDANLPFVTVMLLGVSHAVTSFWWVFIIVMVGLGVFFSRWRLTKSGRYFIDGLKMHAWPVKSLFNKVYMARFARTGTTLIASGVPLLQVLDITAKAVGNVRVADSLREAAQKVKGGKALSDALENDPNFLELVPNMLRIGEQSGAIEAMMGKTADYFEKEVDNQIKTISTVIEPVMMIGLGGAALIIVAAILLPIYSLVGKGFIK